MQDAHALGVAGCSLCMVLPVIPCHQKEAGRACPKGTGWVSFVEEGFRSSLARTSANVVVVEWGDTCFEAQLLQLEETLDEHPDIGYIIGSAVTADAAVSLLRAKGLTGKSRSSPTTLPTAPPGRSCVARFWRHVLQGRLAVDQAIRALEGRLEILHAGPEIRIVDQAGIAKLNREESLAPAWSKPTFEVK